jgi:hypothetical protein
MSGEASLTPHQNITDFHEKVLAYSQLKRILPPDPAAVRVQGYLDMTPDDYRGLSDDELSLIGLDISTFIVRIQHVVDEQNVRAERCKWRITKIVEPVLDQYDAFKTEDKRLSAILDSSAATDYMEMQKNHEGFVRMWEKYIHRLDGVVKSIEKLAYSKR